MRLSAVLAAAFAASAYATPAVLKRAYVTEVTYKTVTVTVQPGYKPTPVPVYNNAAKPKPKPAPVYTPAKPAPAKPKPKPVTPVKQPTYQPAPADGSYKSICLNAHNGVRAKHGAPALRWNDRLASEAKAWASKCKFKHHTNGYGQNLAASAPKSDPKGAIEKGWYSKELKWFNNYWGLANPPHANFAKYGHLTQVLWKSTTSVGCATVNCMNTPLGMHYTVCNYDPPGNYGGQYAKNVFPPKY